MSIIHTCLAPEKGDPVQDDLKRKSITMPMYVWTLLQKEADVYHTNTSMLLQRIVLDYFRITQSDQ
jgi:hypothetical protein